LFNPSTFREIVSGRRRGPAAAALRGALAAAELGYAAAVRLRNRRYDSGKATVHHAGVPVISVGNLTLGGAGKSPLVRWVVRWAQSQDIPAVVISRGYRAAGSEPNDEALELERLLPGTPHLENPDRAAAARRAVQQFGSRLIVLDDAFQHRRLARNLDIVVLDALEPFGFGRVFPRGMLREPLDGLRRADAVVLARADLIDENARKEIWQIVERHAPKAIRASARHAPSRLLSAAGEETPPDALRGQSVAAFCGLGNPRGFRRTLEQLGCRTAGFREFPDHHPYGPRDLDELGRWAAELHAAAVLCTLNDLVKIPAERLSDIPLWAVAVEMDFLDGGDSLAAALAGVLR